MSRHHAHRGTLFATDKPALVARLRAILPAHCLLVDEEDLRPYECDGLTAYPRAAAGRLPAGERRRRWSTCCAPATGSACRSSRAARAPGCRAARCRTRRAWCCRWPRFNRILRVDPLARVAVVQPGVRNLAISEAAAPHGLYYAPDPSSQIACTIGGNVAENSGGVHCLKYGLTVHNVLRVRVVTHRGRDRRVRHRSARCARLRPAGADDRLRGHARRRHRGHRQAGAQAGAGAGGHGLVRRCRQGRRRGGGDHRRRHHPGRAGDDGQAGDGRRRAFRQGRLRPRRRGHPAVRIRRHAGGSGGGDRARCARCSSAAARRDIRVSRDEAERLRFWAGRKAAFPAVGRISPDYYCMDGTIPRKRLAEMLARHRRHGEEVRPALRQRLPRRRRQPASADHVRRHHAGRTGSGPKPSAPKSSSCRSTLGGTITGEHGVGIEKINQMCVQFDAPELDAFHRIKSGLRPGRACSIPARPCRRLHRCAEFGRMHVHHGDLKFPGTGALLMTA